MTFEPLGAVLKTVKGKRPRRLSEAPAPGLVPYLDISAIEHGTQRQFADPSDSKVVPAGTLVMVWDGARSGWVGFAPFEGALGSTLAALESPFEKSYLAAFLKAHFHSINSNHRGTGIPHVNPDFLKSLEVPIMRRDTQVAIAKLCDEATDRTTSSLGHLAAARRAIDRARRAILGAACSGRLTSDWRQTPDDGSGGRLAKELMSSGPTVRQQWKVYNEAAELPELPESWGVVPFGNLVVNHDGRRVPVKSTDRHGRQGLFPYYGASGIIDHVDSYLFHGDFLLISEDGANLLARVTPIAFRARGRFWVNNHAHVVQSRQGVSEAFLELAINGRDIRNFVTGSAQPKLTQAALNAMPIAVPSTAEQNEIVRRVEQLLALADTMKGRIAAAAKRLDKSSQAVLARAFRGDAVWHGN